MLGDYGLKIKDLKEIIKDLPDDMPVFYQRIEDFYFTENHWTTITTLWYSYGHHRFMSEYIPAFDAYKAPEEDIFIINAHYWGLYEVWLIRCYV